VDIDERRISQNTEKRRDVSKEKFEIKIGKTKTNKTKGIVLRKFQS